MLKPEFQVTNALTLLSDVTRMCMSMQDIYRDSISTIPDPVPVLHDALPRKRMEATSVSTWGRTAPSTAKAHPNLSSLMHHHEAMARNNHQSNHFIHDVFSQVLQSGEYHPANKHRW